jgi:hypothetical protein
VRVQTHERSEETVPGDHAPYGSFREHLERVIEPPIRPKNPSSAVVAVYGSQRSIIPLDAHVQLRGTARAERGRGENRREDEQVCAKGNDWSRRRRMITFGWRRRA